MGSVVCGITPPTKGLDALTSVAEEFWGECRVCLGKRFPAETKNNRSLENGEGWGMVVKETTQ